MNVPFVDLKNQFQSLRDDLLASIDSVCAQGSFILGPEVAKFESEFAKFLEVEQSVGVSSGTEALALAFRALGIGKGDEVIIPANTFVATAIGVILAGGKPIPVDINPKTFLLDYELLESAVSGRTKAICPVHLYGRAANMGRILSFAKKHELLVVEDAAQAHGARWQGKRVGTFGEFGCFSFYPGKNLGAYGDAGAICSKDTSLCAQIRRMRNYGSEQKYLHPEWGTNSRLDSIQAAVLSLKLQHLEKWNACRHRAATRYVSNLKELESQGVLSLPELATAEEHVFHLFVIQVDERERVSEQLTKKDIQNGIHYPIPIHLQDAYRDWGYQSGSFPVTERLATRILSLPMFPEISDAQIDYVCEQLKACF